MNVSGRRVVVVGAGPAGSSLAIRLARRGLTVQLVDRAVFPRFKPCGEFISPECLPLLAELGVLEKLREAGAHTVRGMRLCGFGRRIEGYYGRSRPTGREAPEEGLALRREILDNLLLEQALQTRGVEVVEGLRVIDLLWEAGATRADRGDADPPEDTAASGGGRLPPGRVRGVIGATREGARRELPADFTVGADGLRSRVAAALGLRRRVRWLQRFALVSRYRGVPAEPVGEVHLFPGGYFAGCGVDEGLFTLNLVVGRELIPGGKPALERFFDACAASHPSLGPRLAQAQRIDPVRVIGPLAATTARQVVDGAALIGDACGYVDPVTGEGIYFALRTAALLAEVLPPALAAGRTEAAALAAYPARRRRELGRRLFMARALQRGMRSPLLTRGFMAVLSRSPGLMDWLVERTGGGL